MITTESFSFNGITKSYIMALRGSNRPSWAPIERQLIEVPNRPGGYLAITKTKIRTITVPILIDSDSVENLQSLKEDLAYWLLTDKPTELIFDDEPGRTYFAVVDGSLDIEQLVTLGEGTITFICPDPYKYGNALTTTFLSDIATVTNQGTAETYPTFTATVKAPITYLDIVTEDAYMRIGQPVSIEDTIVEPNEINLNDEMGSLVGWTTAASIDGGVVSGTMKTNGNEFYVDDFGTGNDWHGPSVKKSLSQTLQDFMVELVVSMSSNTRGQVGRIELYLLDINGATIGKVSMKDVLQGDIRNETEIRIGELASGKYILTGTPSNYKDWSSFYGILRLIRVDNTFTAYVSKIDGNGNHVSWIESSPIQVDMLNELAAVQVHIGAQSTISPVTMKIHKLKVFKKNKVSGSVIPYIADINDVIVIDNKTNNILINGESRLDLKDFGASFFPLKKGQNIISYGPSDNVDLAINWQERYL